VIETADIIARADRVFIRSEHPVHGSPTPTSRRSDVSCPEGIC
jgi:hypothetical protein